MKRPIGIIKLLLIALIVSTTFHASGSNYLTETTFIDTIKNKESKKAERAIERDQLRQSHQRFLIRFSSVAAYLDTKISFQIAKGNLTSTLSFEQNLGLPASSIFFTGAFLYRITPRSGIYAQYYGINRKVQSITDKDYIFKSDSIPAGTNIEAHFNTNVISTGYLFSALKEPEAFLGFYFNIYFMIIDTGVKSDFNEINSTVGLIAPLPNFGLLASFKLTKWLVLNGGVGFFSLHTSEFEGSLYSFDISIMTRPVKWLGISLSYQEFDVRVAFPEDDINCIIDYNFRGPAIGLSFIF